ncbi:MAG: hypothetical protein FGM24_11285 [Candidatus Kapabacteria bacterium]|nr:hypothetical protein [Candidatus Kapabacteria bacterium]
MKLNWGWRIAIVYTTFALGTLSFVGFALTKDVDLVRPDYYEQGLRHDDYAAATARAQTLNPLPTANIDHASRKLMLSLPPSMAGAEVSVEMYCPSQLNADRQATITINADGQSELSLSGYAAAPYVLTATWTFGGQTYRFQHSLTLR